MALATRCPGCSTIFRISTAQAAAKGGMVRCGQCRNVFNSLDALVRVEDLELVDEAIGEPERPARAAAFDTAQPATTQAGRDDGAPDSGFGDSEISGVLASLSAPTEDHSSAGQWWMPDPSGRREPSSTAPQVASDSPAAQESSRQEPSAPRRSLHEPAPRTVSTVRTAGESQTGPAHAAAVAGEPDPSPWSVTDGGTGPVFMQPARLAEPVNRTARWTWGTLSFMALVLLLAQAAYMERDEIAVRWPPARPWLITACSMLRCRIDHPAHAESITIESVTIQTPAPDANLYVLTALLRNRDAIDVRYPHLELLLTDVQERTVLRRVLRPEDYTTLGPDDRGFAAQGFAAQSELPVRLTFELDDLRFAGYRLDRFYP